MSRKKNEKRRNQNTNSPARENLPRKNTQNGFGAQVPDDAVEDQNNSGSAVTLNPVCPDPESGFQPLTRYLWGKLSKCTWRYMKQICEERSITLNYKYWQTQIERILRAPDPKTAMVVPVGRGLEKALYFLRFCLR